MTTPTKNHCGSQIVRTILCLALLSSAAWALPANAIPLGGWLEAQGSNVTRCVRVLTVIPGEALDQAGIRPGDAILACNAYDFSTSTADVLRVVYNACLPGPTAVTARIAVVRALPGAAVPTNAPEHVALTVAPPRALQCIPMEHDRMARAWELSITTALAVVTQRLVAATQRAQDAWHTRILDHVMQWPGDLSACAHSEAISLEQAARAHQPLACVQRDGHLHRATPAGNPLADFVADLDAAGADAVRAFAALSTAQVAALCASPDDVATAMDTWFYLQDDTNALRYLANWRVLQSALTFNGSQQLVALERLDRWLRPEGLAALTNAVQQLARPTAALTSAGCSGSLLAVITSRWGTIVIGGPERNTYGPEPLAIIDVGGHDSYAERCTVGPARPLSLVLDLAGDDEYVAMRGPGVAAGIAGVDVILDCAGNDYYSCPRWGLGAGFFGIGMLWDMAGNDTYVGERFVQGVGLFGSGMIIDEVGDDVYHAQRFAQGLGLPGGQGCIADLCGNDYYAATPGAASVYGMAGVYNSFAQGAGVGLRLIASGGLGLLLDGAGDDRYTAGEFAQGVGYYLGTGMLVDRRGNDCYRATRYCQGAAAHDAAGALLDSAGDDIYLGRVTACQSAAWDTSVTCLQDAAGNDAYHSVGLALGAACIGSYAQFEDFAGTDDYVFVGAEAAGSSWQPPGETNVAIFADYGGCPDRYAPQGASAAANNTKVLSRCIGVFEDR